MAAWDDDDLGELRAEFVRSSLLRVERMGVMLVALRRDPSDASVWRELMRDFHGLAGAGASYGFPELTRLGLLGEQLTGGGTDSAGQADAASLPALEAMLEELRRELATGDGVAPRAAERAVAEAAAPVPAQASALLVGGDLEWRRLLRRRLEQEDYQVAETVSRAGALALLRERLPDALVCDVVLPDGAGRELVAYLRQLPGGQEVAILMASGRAGLVDKMEALASGADGYFEKPVDWDALLRRLRQLRERRREAPPRVLCVEDLGEEPAFLRTLLASAGYEVQTLADPSRLEEALASFRPDLLLVDTLLPGMSGYDLTRYLRQELRFASLPVLFLTTQAHPDARIQGLRAGGDDHLLKPVAPQLLLTAVAAHLERARLVKAMLERDSLTRLLNDAAFRERAKEAYQRAQRRPEHPLLLLLLDLDDFKSVNERFGYATGDRVLAAFSAALRRQLRGSDVVGRYAGGEFAILLERLDPADALRLALRLRDELLAAEHRAADGTAFHLTLSAGLAALDVQGMSFDDWRRAAAEALHAAKAQGRNRVLVAAAR